MDPLVSLLADRHDPKLAFTAMVIAMLAAWTALQLVTRSRTSRPGAREAWLVAGAIVAGSGVWTAHFMALLAHEASPDMGYAFAPTALSSVAGMVGAGLAFWFVVFPPRPRLFLGGAVLGLAIAVTHHIGMLGLAASAKMLPDYAPQLLSLTLGIGLAMAATRLAFGSASRYAVLWGAVLYTAAVGALHFVSMAGISFDLTAASAASERGLSGLAVAVAAGAACFVIIAFALVAVIVDQHLAERTAKEAMRLQELVDATFEGIVIHRDGRILDANASFLGLIGRGSREALIGENLWELLPALASDGSPGLADTSGPSLEAELHRGDGGILPVEVLGRSIEHERRPAQVVAVRDLTDRRDAEARIRHLAHHDGLTDLPNRILFNDRLQQALARAERKSEQVAILCLDLDRFKEVNDLYGHGQGDELLKQVAESLRERVRDSDTVARLGGDEFAIIQTGVEQPRHAATLAERLVGELSRTYELCGLRVDIGVSIGIALFPDDGDDAELLLSKGDMALYRAKAEGRGTYRVFEPSMDDRLRERRLMERELKAAIREGTLALHYQPQASTETGEIVGFEALVRWPHPERGMIPPVEFIPLAEETGLIRPLGEWVLRTACQEATRWAPHLRLGVNLSPAQFVRDDLPELVASTLEESGLSPARLELEITESVLITDIDKALNLLERLKALGVRVAMDDFGTGYSSLNYLQRFPFDRIKIDRSFVANLAEHLGASSIIKAVIGLGRSLDIDIIAEGVETEDQRSTLQAERCAEIQGFLIGRPMPPEEVARFMSNRDNTVAGLAAARNPGRDVRADGANNKSVEAEPMRVAN